MKALPGDAGAGIDTARFLLHTPEERADQTPRLAVKTGVVEPSELDGADETVIEFWMGALGNAGEFVGVRPADETDGEDGDGHGGQYRGDEEHQGTLDLGRKIVERLREPRHEKQDGGGGETGQKGFGHAREDIAPPHAGEAFHDDAVGWFRGHIAPHMSDGERSASGETGFIGEGVRNAGSPDGRTLRRVSGSGPTRGYSFPS